MEAHTKRPVRANYMFTELSRVSRGGGVTKMGMRDLLGSSRPGKKRGRGSDRRGDQRRKGGRE